MTHDANYLNFIENMWPIYTDKETMYMTSSYFNKDTVKSAKLGKYFYELFNLKFYKITFNLLKFHNNIINSYQRHNLINRSIAKKLISI